MVKENKTPKLQSAPCNKTPSLLILLFTLGFVQDKQSRDSVFDSEWISWTHAIFVLLLFSNLKKVYLLIRAQ